MPNYTLDVELPSVNATKDLLLDLENYVLRKASEITGEPPEKIRKSYDFIIVDSSGRENLGGVSEFKFAFYPNDTKEIIFKCDSVAMDWEVRLARNTATIKLFLSKESAREIVLGIHTELTRLFTQYSNTNHWFHNGTFQIIFLLMPSIGLPALSILFTGNPRTFLGCMLLFFTPTGAFFLAGNFFKPYCVFQTRRNETRQYWFKWFLTGVLAFLLFTVAGVYLRKSLLHF